MTAAPATARATRSAAPASVPRRRATPLEVVRRRTHRWHLRLRLTPATVGVGLVVASLAAVVGGFGVLAQGQVRLAALQASAKVSQGDYDRAVIAAAQRTSPQRMALLGQRLHLVPAGSVGQLPIVPLSIPLAVPTLAPAPWTPTATSTSATTAPATTSSTGTVPTTPGIASTGTSARR